MGEVVELHPCYQNLQFDIQGTDHRQNEETFHFKGFRTAFRFQQKEEKTLRIRRQGRLWWTKAAHLYTVKGTNGIIFGWGTAAYRRRTRREERRIHGRDRADSMYCRMEGAPTSMAFPLSQGCMQPEPRLRSAKALEHSRRFGSRHF